VQEQKTPVNTRVSGILFLVFLVKPLFLFIYIFYLIMENLPLFLKIIKVRKYQEQQEQQEQNPHRPHK